MDKIDQVLERQTTGFFGQRVDYEVPITAYPCESGVIIVNSPGAGEAKDGGRGRYVKVARHLQERGVGAMVTYGPPLPDAQGKFESEPYSYRDASWNLISVESICHAIDYALENAVELCGSSDPVVHLSGFSAGGSVCGAVAYRYPSVKSLLFMSAYDSVAEYFYEGIRQFTGEVYLTYGIQDPLAGFMAYFLRFSAPLLNGLHVRGIPDCDHGFRGDTNGRILSKAYLWAFAGDTTFPSPEGGIPLNEE